MGNFNRKADLTSTAATEQLMWNKTGAYVLPTAEARLEISSTSVKDVVSGVGARTAKLDYLDALYKRHYEIIRLGDYAANKVAKGDGASITVGTEWKNLGIHTSLDCSGNNFVFTPAAQYDGIMQDVDGKTIPIVEGHKYLVKVNKSSVASGDGKQLAVKMMNSDPNVQVETATIVGTITTTGDATVTVTGALVTGSPLAITVALAESDEAADIAGKIRTALDIAAITDNYVVGGATDKVILTAKVKAINDATLNISVENDTCVGITDDTESVDTTPGALSIGQQQVETATVVGNVTLGGKAKVTVSDKNHVGSPLDILVDVAGTKQVETATVALDEDRMKSGGNATVIVTCTGMTSSPKTVTVAVAGTKQVETATCAGTITLAGNALVTLTSAHHNGVRIKVPVALSDDASAIALAIRTVLADSAVVTEWYTVSGATDKVILTAKYPVANDAKLNIAIANDTCTGITAAATSANTTPGVVADDVNQVATKIRAALLADANVAHPSTGFLTVSGSGNKVILTTKTCIANIANLNISIADGTCDGITTAATSVNTTAGVVADTASVVGGRIRTALALYSDITDYYTIGGSTTGIILTSILRQANDNSLNIAIDNYTCTGLTAAPTSTNTTAGIADGTDVVPLTNFDAISTTDETVISAFVTAISTSAKAVFAIIDTSTADFVSITLDDIMLIDITALEYDRYSLAELKLYFATFFLSAETTKRTMAADIFRVNGLQILTCGTELDPAGNISLKEVSGVGTNVYAYIEEGKFVAEQLIFTVPYSSVYRLDAIRVSSMINTAATYSKFAIKTNYDRVANRMNPALAYVEDTAINIADTTEEYNLDLQFPPTSDIMVMMSGDDAAVVRCTLYGSML